VRIAGRRKNRLEVKSVLVTGASGFLGWHLAKQLLEKGESVRALVRPASQVRDLAAVEVVRGDLRDRDSLDHAASGCHTVFHVAADYRLWARRPQDLYESNVEGTRNLLAAAWKSGVERFVYTSTVGCIGFVPGGLGDETTPVTLGQMSGHYKRSKFLAEQVAQREAEAGMPVYIVNPTAPIGDHDFRPTPTGRIIVDFLKGDMPAYIDTGLNLVGAADTARGHLLAADRGRPGERYILGGENLTLGQILGRLAALTGKPAPKVQLPYALAYTAGLFSTAWASLTGQEPRVPMEGVRMARQKMWVSTAKAKRDLGFEAAPVEDALRGAVDWFQQGGYC
jgi:dihydroflavonol-4-reductase